MQSQSFRLLVITDTHYTTDPADAAAAVQGRHCLLGRELTRRAIEDAKRRGPGGGERAFHAIALLGDLVNEARTPSAGEDMQALRAEIEKAAPGVPLLVVPGNHDNDGGLVLRTFETRGGVRELGGYRFVTFCDEYEDHQYCTRSTEGLQLIRDLAAAEGGPIVTLQHNPMDPVIENDYPYMLSNRADVLRGYEQGGVLLSLSGHWHWGQPLHAGPGGVRYFTAPALCIQPFSYAIVTLRGTEVSVEQRQLSLPAGGPAVWDIHVHTQFSYCGPTMRAADAVARARLFGLGGICLTEHAPQLYSTPEVFWSGRHVREPQLWRSPEHSRMPEFRKTIDPLRSPFVRVGLEVELDVDGNLTILDDDRRWVDVLVGAVHFLPEDAASLSDAEFDRAVMRTNEGLLAAGVHVLAHPWRYHQGKKRRVPAELFGPMADMVRQAGAAAEVNLHISDTDPAFIRACVERGTKLVFGSDAHEMWEPALLHRHLELLQQAAGTDDVAGLLAVPG